MEKESDEIKKLKQNSFKELSAGLGDLESLKNDFDDAENDFGDDLYKAMHDHTNKYAIKLYKAIFSLTLIFSLLNSTFSTPLRASPVVKYGFPAAGP